VAKAKTATTKVANPNARVRRLNGQPVTACWYNGRAVGRGSYMAAMVEGVLVLDAAGRPVPLRRCGQLEPS
jgi:hypothetical protein